MNGESSFFAKSFWGGVWRRGFFQKDPPQINPVLLKEFNRTAEHTEVVVTSTKHTRIAYKYNKSLP